MAKQTRTITAIKLYDLNYETFVMVSCNLMIFEFCKYTFVRK